MKKTYPGLDFVRFAAALAVMFFHLSVFVWRGNDPVATAISNDLSGFRPLFNFGWVGVPIFFVLSGFVISFSAQGKTWSQFVQGRVLRLYPAAWICASLTALVLFADADILPRYMRSLALWPRGPWVDAAYWTLGLELMFYGAVAIVLAMFGHKRLAQFGVVLGALSAAYWILKSLDFATGRHFDAVFSYLSVNALNLTLLPHGCHFAIGMLLFSVSQSGLTPVRSLMLLLCGATGVMSVAATARSYMLDHGMPSSALVLAPIVWGVAVAAIAASGYVGADRTRLAGIARMVGLATYPLYLLHQEIGIVIMRAVQPLGSGIALFCAIAVALLATMFVVRVENYPRRLLASVIAGRKPEHNRAREDVAGGPSAEEIEPTTISPA